MRARRSIPALLALSLLAAAGACRDSGGDDGDDTPIDAGDGDAPNPDDMKIQVVQDDATAVGTPVTLRGVVVVAKDTYGSRTGNLFVMEPEGGAFSGVLVFGAPLEQFDAVAVGDLVDITNAEKDEFALVSDTSGRTTTELTGAGGGDMLIVKVGTGTVPAPQSVDAAAIAALPADMRDAEREKWEGVLIKVSNVSVTQDVRHISGNPDDPTFNEFSITGDYRVDSSLSEVNLTPPTVRAGDCLASVTGMGDYFFNYKILPRMIGDIVPGGTNCPVPPSTTVEAIQTGQVTVMTMVRINDAVVTALDTIGSTRGVWISQSAQSAANQGIFVFTGNTTPAVTIGQHVNVAGRVVEFDVNPMAGDKLTEIDQATVSVAAGTSTPLPLEGVAVAALASIANGEPYESVFVKLTTLRVMSETAPGDRVVLTNGTDTIVMDDDIFDYVAGTYTAGMCFSSVSGIMTTNLFDDERRFLPRSAADLVSAACP
jgi:predicted extracellular nuclease